MSAFSAPRSRPPGSFAPFNIIRHYEKLPQPGQNPHSGAAYSGYPLYCRLHVQSFSKQLRLRIELVSRSDVIASRNFWREEWGEDIKYVCNKLNALGCSIPVGAMDGNRTRVRFPFLRFSINAIRPSTILPAIFDATNYRSFAP